MKEITSETIKDSVWNCFSTRKTTNHKKSHLQISKHVYWFSIKDEVTDEDDLFYSWSYDYRWYLNQLRKKGLVDYVTHGRKNYYCLTELAIKLSTVDTYDSVMNQVE